MKTFKEAIAQFHCTYPYDPNAETYEQIQQRFQVKYDALSQEILQDPSTQALIREIIAHMVERVEHPHLLILLGEELRHAIAIAFTHGVVTGIEMEKESLPEDYKP